MKLSFLASLLVFFVGPAHAQYIGAGAQFGVGLHGGAGICPGYGGGQLPEGLVEIEDEIAEEKERLVDFKSELKDLKDRREDLEDRVETYEDLMCAEGGGVLKAHVCTGVKNHLRNIGEGDQSLWTESSVCQDDGPLKPWPNFCEKQGKRNQISEEATRWHTAVDETGNGKIYQEVCDPGTPFTVGSARGNNAGVKNCKDALAKLGDLYVELGGLGTKETLEAQIKAIEARLKMLRKDKKRLVRDFRRGETEADFCYSCVYRNDKPISTTEKVGSLLLGGLGAYLGYKGYKYGVDQSAKLGWPVAAHPAVVMTGILPSVSMGIYGATNGFGTGGCTGNPMGIYGPGGLYGGGLYPQSGGAFGYPQGYGVGLGGGVYTPGMGPWGMAGPWGGGGLYGGGVGVPMMGGIPIGGGGAIAAGIGGVGFIAGGGIAGYPISGGMGAIGGIPGMIGGGLAGGIGITGGYPLAGGFAGGIPGAFGAMGGIPGMIGGGFAGGIPGGIGAIGGGAITAPYPMGGGFAGGIPGGFGAIGGGIPGGFGAIGGGIPGGIGAIGGGMAGLQYQQQMMQMQQQQMQMWIQQQQQAQQDYFSRQQTIGQLQNQLVQIQMQIQQVQYGVYGSGFSSGSGTLPYPGQQAPYPGGGPGGFPGATQPMPYPNFPAGGGGTTGRGRLGP